MSLYDTLKFLHIITVVFMAAPLYNLVVVNERVKFGKAHLDVDRYFESIIRGNSIRCYVFQVTALVTGVALAILGGSVAALFTNWVLLAKLLLIPLIIVGAIAVAILMVALPIIAGLKARDGQEYTYPITIRFLK